MEHEIRELNNKIEELRVLAKKFKTQLEQTEKQAKGLFACVANQNSPPLIALKTLTYLNSQDYLDHCANTITRKSLEIDIELHEMLKTNYESAAKVKHGRFLKQISDILFAETRQKLISYYSDLGMKIGVFKGQKDVLNLLLPILAGR